MKMAAKPVVIGVHDLRSRAKAQGRTTTFLLTVKVSPWVRPWMWLGAGLIRLGSWVLGRGCVIKTGDSDAG